MHQYCKYQQPAFILPAPTIEGEHPFWASLYEIICFVHLQQLWSHTFYGIKLKVEKLQRHGHQIEALKVLVNGLSERHFWVNHTQKWWILMCIAIHLIQDRLTHNKEQIREPIQSLLKLCINAPQPWQGHDVAYCFAQMSLWSFDRGDLQNAIELAKSAMYAQPSWGYAEYLLGWYGLLLEGIDPALHFSRAIKANGCLFDHFIDDPLCQQFPEIFNQIKEANHSTVPWNND